MPENRFEKLRVYLSQKSGQTLSATRLAELLNVSTPTITEAENGTRPPSPKAARALYEKYKVSEEWYLTGEGYAPWESDLSIEWQIVEKQLAEGQFGGALHVASTAIKISPQRKLIDHWIRAGKNPLYREALYKVIEEMDILPIYHELLELKQELAEQRAAAAEPAVSEPEPVSPPAVTPGGHKYAGKARPAIRLTAEPTFESTEVILQFPAKPANLEPEDSTRWDRNELALRRWEQTETARRQFPRGDVPTWALERFCREVVHFYEGGTLEGVGGILKDFIQEGKKK